MSTSSSSKRTTEDAQAPQPKATGATRRRTSTAADSKPPPTPEEIISFTAWRPGFAIRAGIHHDLATVEVPLVGRVTLPGFAHLAWYGGVAALLALEVVEPPVAALLVVAKVLADSRHHELVRSFGEGVESGI